MIMKYEWQHFWKVWEQKLKTIFGEPEKKNRNTKETLIDDDYVWESGESLNRLNDPEFIKNVEKL